MFCVVCVTDRLDEWGLHHDIAVEFVPAFDLWFIMAFYHLYGARERVKGGDGAMSYLR